MIINTSKNRLSDSVKTLLVYYLVIILFMLLFTSPNAETSSIVRYGFLLAVFVPVISKKEMLPFVVVCFCAISRQSFSPILPSSSTIYLGICMLFVLINNDSIKIRINISIVLVTLYFILDSYLHYDVQGFIKWLIIALLLCMFIKDKISIDLLAISTIYISLFLSLLFVVFGKYFQFNYLGLGDGELERIGWINPNEFGATVACGLVVSVGYLLDVLKIESSKYFKTLCWITIGFALYVLLMNASRSSMIAASSAVLLFILFSNKSISTKLLMCIGLIGIAIFILKSNMFELFIRRIQDEDSMMSGSGRFVIWIDKINEFNNSNFGELLFGVGREKCNLIGLRQFSTHNDFVTAFVGYGAIGLVLLIYVMVLPFVKASNNTKPVVISLMTFLILENCMMEPFFRGNLLFYMLYSYIFMYSKNNSFEKTTQMKLK